MNKKSILSALVLSLSIGLFAIIIALSFLSFQEDYPRRKESITVLNDSWKITCREKTIYSDIPNEIPNDSCSQIYMENTLPAGRSNYNCLMLYTVQSEVKVWLANTLIYEFTAPKNSNIKIYPPSMYHFIDIDMDMDKATNAALKIEITPTFSATAGRVPLVYYGQRAILESKIIKQCLPNVVCCIVLFVLTVCTLLYGCLARHASKKSKKDYVLLPGALFR